MQVEEEHLLSSALARLNLNEGAAAGLRRLAATPQADVSDLPRRKLAAVLVLLYVDSSKELNVLLTTRALTLRTSPGETALPGGRVEEQDKTVLDTALREAFEEVALPLDTPLIHLTTLAPFLSYTLLYVVPVVCLLDSTKAEEVISSLVPAPAEVSAVFSARLSRFLGIDAAEQAYVHSFHDVPWVGDAPFRLHAYKDETFASDVTGLTADILLTIAMLAAGEDAELGFDRSAPGQLPWPTLVQHVLDGQPAKPRAK